MKNKNRKLAVVVAGLLFLAPLSINAEKTKKELAEQVRHELVMLPFYSVFDDLAFRVEGSKVVLLGNVTRPTLKSSAENVVKRLEGVTAVENKITVLPLSPFDDSIRLRTARAVYGASALNRYALGAQPPIRIIVNNGNVTLEGVVANEMDRNIAGIQANGVPGVFAVTNNLRVVNSRS